MIITYLKKFNREDTHKFLKRKNLISVELGVARGDFSKERMNMVKKLSWLLKIKKLNLLNL